MTDTFASYSTSLPSPASNADTATPDGNADQGFFSRALKISASGNMRRTAVEGGETTVFSVAGIAFPTRARRIRATDTIPSDVVGLY